MVVRVLRTVVVRPTARLAAAGRQRQRRRRASNNDSNNSGEGGVERGVPGGEPAGLRAAAHHPADLPPRLLLVSSPAASIAYLLRPLRQPRVIAEIIVSALARRRRRVLLLIFRSYLYILSTS